MAVMRETEAARPYGRQWVDVRAYRLRQNNTKRNGLDGAGEMRWEEREEGEVEMKVRSVQSSTFLIHYELDFVGIT